LIVIIKKLDWLKIELINKLKDYRDQYLAHDDIKRKVIKLSVKDFESILKLTKEIMDFLHWKLEESFYLYDNFRANPVADIEEWFKCLKNYYKI